jgi:WXXGXW repeat (2 copies)
MKTKIGLSAFVLAALLFLGLPPTSSSGYVAVSVGFAPPSIPVFAQPLCPAPGYLWVPGYWAYGDFGYYWVPGAWVLPPQVGLLWTPGYWGYSGSTYAFHTGYWGPSVGFYGGINYGYGYYGSGYYGGEWVGSTFRYNTAVSRVNTNVIPNTYVNREVVRNATGTRASFNGPGGVQTKPNAREQAAAKAEHVAPTSAQRSRVTAAKNDPTLRARNNNGKPKATAVRTFENKHGPKVAGTATGVKSGRVARNNGPVEQTRAEKKANASRQARTEKRPGAAKQARSGKANERAAGKTASRSHLSSKTARNKEVASSQSHNSTQTHHGTPRKVANASHARHHEQAASHHQRVASDHQRVASHHQRVASHHRQAAPHHRHVASHYQHAAPNHRRAATAQNGKKEKKKHGGHS